MPDSAAAAPITPPVVPDPASPGVPDPNLLATVGDSPAVPVTPETPALRAPEAYADFTIPEGTTFDEPSLTEYKSLAKELDLPQDQAQKLLEFGGSKLKEKLEAPYKLWTETQAAWQAEVKADPEIGGANFDASLLAASEVFKPGGPIVKSPEEAVALRQALDATGAGNHPAIVKMFVRLGKALQEPGALSNVQPKRVKDAEQLLDSLYPSMAKRD